jgi:hypothetical protein
MKNWTEWPFPLRVFLRGLAIIALLAVGLAIIVGILLVIGEYLGIWSIPTIILLVMVFSIAYEIEEDIL